MHAPISGAGSPWRRDADRDPAPSATEVSPRHSVRHRSVLRRPQHRGTVRAGPGSTKPRQDGGWAHHAAFTLDGLDDHGGGLVVDGRRGSVEISVWHEDHVTGQRFERLAVLGGRRQRERSIVRPWKEPSMAMIFVRPVSRVILKAASLAGARVRTKWARRSMPSAAGGQLGQPLTQFDLRDGREEVRDMAGVAICSLTAPDDGRVGLTQPADRDAAEHVGSDCRRRPTTSSPRRVRAFKTPKLCIHELWWRFSRSVWSGHHAS